MTRCIDVLVERVDKMCKLEREALDHQYTVIAKHHFGNDVEVYVFFIHPARMGSFVYNNRLTVVLNNDEFVEEGDHPGVMRAVMGTDLF